jgi:hypothetical protein
MGCLNWRESGVEQKSRDLIPVQACDWLSRKRYPVRPPVSPVSAKLIFKEGMLDPHVQFQSPMEMCSKFYKLEFFLDVKSAPNYTEMLKHMRISTTTLLELQFDSTLAVHNFVVPWRLRADWAQTDKYTQLKDG